MVKAKQQVRTADDLKMAYFATKIANMCRQTKEPIEFSEMAKPFLPEKSADDIRAEREEFFEDFYKQRKEVKDGNSSEPAR